MQELVLVERGILGILVPVSTLSRSPQGPAVLYY